MEDRLGQLLDSELPSRDSLLLLVTRIVNGICLSKDRTSLVQSCTCISLGVSHNTHSFWLLFHLRKQTLTCLAAAMLYLIPTSKGEDASECEEDWRKTLANIFDHSVCRD